VHDRVCRVHYILTLKSMLLSQLSVLVLLVFILNIARYFLEYKKMMYDLQSSFDTAGREQTGSSNSVSYGILNRSRSLPSTSF
jgi:hypothetical protein